jgi:hypothetical protein
MDKFRAYGQFLKRGEHIYRTSAHLQWGDSTKSLGCCVLLNPGSATLEKVAPELYSRLLADGKAHGQVIPDPTMNQLATLLERIYGQSLEGQFKIYNLFWLQNTDDQEAIEQYVELVAREEFQFDESLIELVELKQHPWVLLGWGVKKHKRHWHPFVQIKDKWVTLIQTSGVPCFGKAHPKQKSGYYYYHPCPQIPTHRPQIINDLEEIYNRDVRHLKINNSEDEIHGTI